MERGFERAPIGILEVSPSGVVRDVNGTAGALLEADPEIAAGADVGAVFPDSVETRVPRAFETPPEAGASFEEYYPEPDRWLSVDLVPGEDTVYVYLRDETDEHRRTQRLESIRSDLDRVTVANELVADILGDLVAASTREEIAETICRRLGETDIYAFAWIGDREIGSEDIAIRAAAGTTGRTIDAIEAALEADEALPELRAVDSGRPEVVQPLGEGAAIPERIRRAAFADGVQSLLAVPLTYGSSVYGVVGIYAAEQDGFSERERRTFGTVGKMAGFAVNATRHRSLLLADTVVELTFRLSDPEAPFVAVSEARDARISVTGLVPQGERIVCYADIEIEDGEVDGIENALEDHASVTRTRIVAEHGNGGSIEVFLREGAPLGHLVSQGGTVQSATFGPEGHRVVVDLPPAEDVRRIADAITRRYDAEVLAKRERQRTERTATEVRDAMTNGLTDRQEDALRTAFFAEYFESPRGSSAEEVAEALGITGPTLLHHLRAGQRKLLGELFEATGRREEPDR